MNSLKGRIRRQLLMFSHLLWFGQSSHMRLKATSNRGSNPMLLKTCHITMTKEINLGSAWPKSFPHRKKSKQVVVWAGGDLQQCEEDDGEESRVETYFPAQRVRDQTEPKVWRWPKKTKSYTIMAATKLNKITLIAFDKSAPEDKYTKDNSDTSKVIEVSNNRRFPTHPVVLCYKCFHFTLALIVLPFGACKIYCFILSIFAFHNAMKEESISTCISEIPSKRS